MEDKSVENLILKVAELQSRLDESEQLIEAIKAGEVDAFINGNNVFTLQTGDYVYRVLIEQIGEGALNVSEEGLIVYTNRAFVNMMNLNFDKLLGVSIFDLVHESSRNEFGQIFEKALTGNSKGEINLSVNNNIIPVYISLTSLQPQLNTIGIIVTDFTEKKSHEKIILKYQQDLELKNFELVNRNSELASFSYIASHDLQEPLRKIQTFSSLIKDKEGEFLSDTVKDYLKRMHNASLRMQTLIDDLLTYSRTNSVERVFIETSLETIVKEVADDLKEELQQSEATLEMGIMCSAEIIPFQFKQLFHNLISNSLKFSNGKEKPLIKIVSEVVDGRGIKLKKISKKNKYCHIKVSDNGIGFEKEFSERIFELFQRLHGKGKYKGTGIGLAIVKKIVDNHKGIIIANSELDKGATFDVYIPVKQYK